MKKLLFLILGVPALSFGQWSEGFDTAVGLPAGWAVINNGDPNGWRTRSSGESHTTARMATIKAGTTAHDDYLITKAINVQDGISDNISFYIKSAVVGRLENYEILLSTTDQTASAFTKIL